MKTVFQAFNLFKSFLQFNPGPRLFGDIYCGPNKFREVARLVHDRMPDSMEVPDGSIGKNNAIVRFMVRFLDFGLFEEFLNAFCVLRIISIEPKFRGRLNLIGSDAEYSIHFRRDCDFPRSNVMFPAAGMAQSLRLKQICFTASQLGLRILQVFVSSCEFTGSLCNPEFQMAACFNEKSFCTAP